MFFPRTFNITHEDIGWNYTNIGFLTDVYCQISSSEVTIVVKNFDVIKTKTGFISLTYIEFTLLDKSEAAASVVPVIFYINKSNQHLGVGTLQTAETLLEPGELTYPLSNGFLK